MSGSLLGAGRTTTRAVFRILVDSSSRIRAQGGVTRARLPSSRRELHHTTPKLFRHTPLAKGIAIGVPLVAGAVLLLSPTEPSPVPNILTSPAVIPCSNGCTSPKSRLTHQMSSPIEDDKTILRRILDLLRDRIWEPIRTAGRFVHLVVLFAPVILTSPMLLVGRKRGKKRGERRGAIWWYGFLVAQMQRAGPTFIKVSVQDAHLPTYTLILITP